ncbi:hypothetical protein [Mucilaginibacter auburnensis]|uniref:Uncharacterized protein n=1 Tax=Mucilaginibacter auburnensis TaxID=1457233 RepID=A0A2H9VLR2_9SPHI|nr:hypothetical protein [Mucilaginibacter auburnensis]PJJ79261.1 hypothetical protein CLV57_2388 [Mucilaginibacter auburnensis]
MPGHRKYCTEDFVLTKVMTRPPAFIYLAALAAFMVAGCFYVFVIRALFFRGGLGLAVGIMILVMMLILKTQERAVTIYLDEKSLFLNGTRYLQQQIESLVTYDPERRGPVRTDLRIRLKNGTNIYITDTRLFGSTDQEQRLLLQKLVKAMIKRLDLELLATSHGSTRMIYIPKSPTIL